MVLGLALPFLNMMLIDYGLMQNDINYSIKIIIVFGMALLLIDVSTAIYNYIINYFETINSFILRHNIFQHIRQQKNINKNNDTIPIFTNDIDIMKTKLTVYIESVFQILQLLTVIVILIIVDIRILFSAILLIILLPLIPLYISKFLSESSFNVQKKKANFTSYLIESMRLSKEIRLNKAETKDYKVFNDKLNSTLAPILKLHYLNSYFYLNNIIYSIFTIITLFIGANNVLQNELTVGELVALITYLSYISNPITTLLSYYSQIKVINGSEIKYKQILSNKIYEKISDYKIRDKQKNSILKINNYKSLFINTERKLNINITSGEWVLIHGSSGSGKSTLLDSISNINTNYVGNIFYQNTNIRNIPNHILYDDIFYMTQDYEVFEGSYISNTLHQIEDIKLFKNILIDLGVEYLIENNDILLGRGYRNVSGGEKQRLFLALSIYKNPQILLLDEPTSALDQENSIIFLNVLHKYRNNKTTIIVSHDKIFEKIKKKVEIII